MFWYALGRYSSLKEVCPGNVGLVNSEPSGYTGSCIVCPENEEPERFKLEAVGSQSDGSAALKSAKVASE